MLSESNEVTQQRNRLIYIHMTVIIVVYKIRYNCQNHLIVDMSLLVYVFNVEDKRDVI